MKRKKEAGMEKVKETKREKRRIQEEKRRKKETRGRGSSKREAPGNHDVYQEGEKGGVT